MSRRRIIQSQIGELPKLPNGYVRCKYLESSGKQCINSQIMACDIGEVRITFAVIRYIDTHSVYKLNGIYGINNMLSDVKLWFNNSANSFSFIFNSQPVADYTDIELYKIYKLSASGTKSSYKGTIALFAVFDSNPNKVMFYSACRIYHFCIPDIANLIPAIRKSDNKPGMYNTVSNLFSTNIGTGEFGYELMDGTYVAPV